jgi:hypothetical protein
MAKHSPIFSHGHIVVESGVVDKKREGNYAEPEIYPASAKTFVMRMRIK